MSFRNAISIITFIAKTNITKRCALLLKFVKQACNCHNFTSKTFKFKRLAVSSEEEYQGHIFILSNSFL